MRYIEFVKDYIHGTKVDGRVQIYKIFDWKYFNEWCIDNMRDPEFGKDMFDLIMRNLFEYKE